MPSTSERQHNAMEAAAHGNSTLGIPASVGKEFVAADKGEKGVHPFRRKRRRKRGGKKHRATGPVSSAPLTLEQASVPSPLPNLRKRLSQLARKSHG